MLLSLYRSKIRSKKWYHRLAFYMFSHVYSTCLFTLSVAKSLICSTAQSFSDESDDDHQPRAKSLKSSQVTTDIRYDKYNHWLVHLDLPHAQRCKTTNCFRKTRYQCSKCQVYLCILPPKSDQTKQCFKDFHGV